MKKNKKYTITIAICAYNETKNIISLLDSISGQKEGEDMEIKEILVVSDGSDDGMNEKVFLYPDARVELIPFPTREGKPTRMNFVMQKLTSDFLVFLDGDVTLHSSMTIQSLIKPFIEDSSVGLVGGKCAPVRSETFLENAINNYMEARSAVEHLYDFTESAYCVRGGMMAISHKFAKNVVLPATILADDAYIYFSAKLKGYKVHYASQAIAKYRSPQTLTDELRQAIRHHAGTPQLYIYFPREVVDAGYRLPRWLLYRIAFYQVITNPIGYLMLKVINLIAAKEGRERYQSVPVRWRTISSSKGTLEKTRKVA